MQKTVAILKHASFANQRIDDAGGVIYGAKVAELGKVACFTGPDGKTPRYTTISPEHVDAFLAHAGNRTIPVHWTHDYREDKKDALSAKVGALKNFRKDEEGNPVADFHVSPGEYRDVIFWNAANDPTGMMLSPVFGYDPKDAKSLPMDFRAADLVECGAATTALLSDASVLSSPDSLSDQPTQTMDETLKAAIQQMITDAFAQAMCADPTDEAMMADAGVTDADKKPEDAKMSAHRRVIAQCSRAFNRRISAALKLAEEAPTKAEAALASNVGTAVSLAMNAGGNQTNPKDAFNAKVKELVDKGVKPHQAVIAAMTAHPELYEASERALFVKPVKL